MTVKSPTSINLPFEFFLLAVLALLWGSSYLFIRVAVTEIPPLTLIAGRSAVATLILLVVLFLRKESLPKDGRSWRLLGIQSFFNAIGAWTLLTWGQQYIDSSMASVLNSTSPIFVVLFTVLITRHESVTFMKLSGVVLGLAGVVLIVGVNVLAGLGQQVAGQLAALGGAMLYACAGLFGRRFSYLPAAVTATSTMVWATVVLVPASLIIESPWTLRPSFEALTAALILSVFCTALALLLYFRLIKTLGALGTASQAYLRAGVGVALGMIFLGELITPVMAIGIVLAILGVIAINAPTRRLARSQ